MERRWQVFVDDAGLGGVLFDQSRNFCDQKVSGCIWLENGRMWSKKA